MARVASSHKSKRGRTIVIDTLTTVYEAEISDFVRGTNRVTQQYINMTDVASGSATSIAQDFASTARSVLDFAATTVRSGIQFHQALFGMRSALPVFGEVIGLTRSLTTEFLDFGRNAVNGFVVGVQSVLGSARATMFKFGDSVIDAFKMF